MKETPHVPLHAPHPARLVRHSMSFFSPTIHLNLTPSLTPLHLQNDRNHLVSPSPLPPSTPADIPSNDRLGKKVRVKCEPDDTIGDLKKLIAAQIGTSAEKIVLKKWYTTFKDHITIGDYEIGNGSSLEMYYS